MKTRIVAVAMILAGLLPPGAASAQSWPNRSIRLVIPFAAGGPTDILGRIFAAVLEKEIGVHVVADNRPGANGKLGVALVAASEPDGYTIGLVNDYPVVVVPLAHDKSTVPYDVSRIASISLFARVDQVFVASRASGFRTLGDLIVAAKGRPGRLRQASGGFGVSQFAIEMLKRDAGIDFIYAAYSGGAPVYAALLSGEVDFSLLSMSAALTPHLESGAFVPLAVTSPARSPALPDVPTTGEAGYADVISQSWYLLVAPAGLNSAVQAKLEAASRRALGSAELQAAFAAQPGTIAAPSSAAEMDAFRSRELARWGRVLAELGIEPE